MQCTLKVTSALLEISKALFHFRTYPTRPDQFISFYTLLTNFEHNMLSSVFFGEYLQDRINMTKSIFPNFLKMTDFTTMTNIIY